MTEIDCKLIANNGIELTEIDVSHYCMEEPERSFAEIVGTIENIIISEEFFIIQSSFLEKYYKEFVDNEENRLEYMDIFKNYLNTVEKYIEEKLLDQIPDFDIKKFQEALENKSYQLDEEIYVMFSTFWDFGNFKSMFLEYKSVKEGNCVDLSNDIIITKISSTLLIRSE